MTFSLRGLSRESASRSLKSLLKALAGMWSEIDGFSPAVSINSNESWGGRKRLVSLAAKYVSLVLVMKSNIPLRKTFTLIDINKHGKERSAANIYSFHIRDIKRDFSRRILFPPTYSPRNGALSSDMIREDFWCKTWRRTFHPTPEPMILAFRQQLEADEQDRRRSFSAFCHVTAMSLNLIEFFAFFTSRYYLFFLMALVLVFFFLRLTIAGKNARATQRRRKSISIHENKIPSLNAISKLKKKGRPEERIFSVLMTTTATLRTVRLKPTHRVCRGKAFSL